MPLCPLEGSGGTRRVDGVSKVLGYGAAAWDQGTSLSLFPVGPDPIHGWYPGNCPHLLQTGQLKSRPGQWGDGSCSLPSVQRV